MGVKTAFAFLEDRIAPVFDAAQRIHVAEVEAGLIVFEAQETVKGQSPIERAMHLVDLGIETLVCGAISNPMREALMANGIQVFPFVAGNLHEVIQVWLRGDLGGDAYSMPGCRGRGQRHGLAHHQEGNTMTSRGGGQGAGSGQGGGRGKGRCQGGRGKGPMGITGAGSVTTTCLCPKCGHRENHQQGVPCTQKTCPQCGTAMTRE